MATQSALLLKRKQGMEPAQFMEYNESTYKPFIKKICDEEGISISQSNLYIDGNHIHTLSSTSEKSVTSSNADTYFTKSQYDCVAIREFKNFADFNKFQSSPSLKQKIQEGPSVPWNEGETKTARFKHDETNTTWFWQGVCQHFKQVQDEYGEIDPQELKDDAVEADDEEEDDEGIAENA